MNAAALPFIIQIAFFGAAGTSFISAHLKNLAANRLSGAAPTGQRWALLRHPFKRPPEKPEALALRRAALQRCVYGAVMLGVGLAAPAVISTLT